MLNQLDEVSFVRGHVGHFPFMVRDMSFGEGGKPGELSIFAPDGYVFMDVHGTKQRVIHIVRDRD